MHGKEFVNCLLSSYFTLVTLISVIMLVLGLHFYPDASFGYIAYAAPLLYGAYGTLTNVVMYSRHELSTKEFLIRKGYSWFWWKSLFFPSYLVERAE